MYTFALFSDCVLLKVGMATAMHMSHPASVVLIYMLPWIQDSFMCEGMGIQFGR